MRIVVRAAAAIVLLYVDSCLVKATYKYPTTVLGDGKITFRFSWLVLGRLAVKNHSLVITELFFTNDLPNYAAESSVKRILGLVHSLLTSVPRE